MKPGARSEFEWAEVPYPTTIPGSSEAGSDQAATFDGVAAVLWVPDPEQRRGWREVYVKQTTKPSGRSMGFGKP